LKTELSSTLRGGAPEIQLEKVKPVQLEDLLPERPHIDQPTANESGLEANLVRLKTKNVTAREAIAIETVERVGSSLEKLLEHSLTISALSPETFEGILRHLKSFGKEFDPVFQDFIGKFLNHGKRGAQRILHASLVAQYFSRFTCTGRNVGAALDQNRELQLAVAGAAPTSRPEFEKLRKAQQSFPESQTKARLQKKLEAIEKNVL